MRDTTVPNPLFGRSERHVPQAGEAEQAVLGGILANNRAFELCSGLRAEHFYYPEHAAVFAEIARLIEAGHLADGVTLKTAFENAGTLDEVGGTAFLARLVTAMVAINVVGEYARTIQDAWMRRQAIEVGSSLIDAAFGTSVPEERVSGREAVAAAVEGLLALAEAQDAGTSGPQDLGAAVDAVLNASDRAGKGDADAVGLSTGIPSVDALWAGMWPGMLDMLAARSEHGKTALGVQVARNVAARFASDAAAGGKPGAVQLFSLEMNRQDIALRMLSSETGVSSDAIRNGRLSTADAASLVRARSVLRGLPLLVQDRKGMTLADIRVEAMAAVRRKHVRLIVIDHLHRIKSDRRGGDALERVAANAEGLKDLAGMLNVPILLLAQISRVTDRRDDPRPRVSDISYAGERDADNVILLWRPELYMGAAPPEQPAKISAEKRAEADAAWWAKRGRMKGRAELIFAKRRFGATGSLWLKFDGPRTRFEDLPPDDSVVDMWGEG